MVESEIGNKVREIDDEKYMRRCIELARNGLCNTAPNPMVGAVIVCDGRIIGEGYHPALLARSTIYVSLEPCAHYGKTPPCADMLVEVGIPRIVIGCQDPFAKVAGRGIRKLREAGREVVVGVLEKECRHLIRRFLTFHTCQRPYVTLKWAQSADGYIDRCRTEGSPVVLSTPETAMLVHKMRAEHSAIMVGRRTALLDNPSLTVRSWYGKSPVRVVLDRRLALPETLRLFDGTVPTLVFTECRHEPVPGVEYVQADFSRDVLPQVLSGLHARGLQSLLVEGGSRLLQSFLDAGLWDEVMVEESPALLGAGVPAPRIDGHLPCEHRHVFGRNFRHYEVRHY